LIKPVFYIIISLHVLASSMWAQQNLVPNGSFEEYYSCPISNDVGNNQLELAKGWWKPSLGTSDYFNRCHNGIVGVPNNFWGYQEAYEGNGYVGIVPISWNIQSGDYTGSEYIQTQLLQPLTSCVEYHFEMRVNLSNLSRYGHSRLGALFTKSPLQTNSIDAIPSNPQVINNNGYLIDTADWVLVSGNFTATGSEKYLCIGYFFDNVQGDSIVFQPPIGFPSEGYSYYYIDNVSLIEVGPVGSCDYDLPNIVTPNNDGINDNWEFSSSSEGHLTIVNRWGNIVLDQTGHKFKWDGENCSDGVYYYTFQSDLISRTGFIQLIR
jgi:gliding motility-associated-like protein